MSALPIITQRMLVSALPLEEPLSDDPALSVGEVLVPESDPDFVAKQIEQALEKDQAAFGFSRHDSQF